MSKHQYPFGLVGNCSYAALINQAAEVVWLCWPRFDSSFIFGSLLDGERGGHFSVQPEWDTYRSEQAYVRNTNILQSTFDCEDGRYRVTDFAPRFQEYERYYRPLMLVRRIEPIEGTPRVRVRCRPVGEYGRLQPEHEQGSNHIRYQGFGAQVRLTANVPLSYIEKEQAFVLNEVKYLVLTWGPPLEAPLQSTVENFYERTRKYWQYWVKTTSTGRFHQEAVIRSALTVKLLQYQDTGAIIASPSSSLPEGPGEMRNWDFRYCWLRDAYFTLKALNELSRFRILEEYANFIENIVLNEMQRYHPLYSIGIDHEPEEKILPLDGYLGNRPVRIGNEAYHNTQNDIYGQVLCALMPLFTDQRLLLHHRSNVMALVMHCLRLIEATMQEADNGLWEFRSIQQLHCYTFLSHWAGSQAALRIARRIGHPEMEALASRLVQESAEMIEACYDAERGAYTQAVGSKHLDASSLQLINMQYLDPRSEKARRHLAAIEAELVDAKGLVRRYAHADDLGEQKAAFVSCSFWYAEALARTGRLDEARARFGALLAYANPLGLFSQNIDPDSGSQWGNFPLLMAHVSLINAAFCIARQSDTPIYLEA